MSVYEPITPQRAPKPTPRVVEIIVSNESDATGDYVRATIGDKSELRRGALARERAVLAVVQEAIGQIAWDMAQVAGSVELRIVGQP